MPAPYTSPTLSSLEGILISGGFAVISKILSFCDPSSIFRFAKANSRTYNIVLRYCAEQWDASTFLGHYFSGAGRILDVLKTEDAYIFGPTVFCFFDRRTLPPIAVDLCIKVESVPRVSQFLDKEGFVFMKKPKGPATFEEAVFHRLVKTIDRKLKSSGDRNTSQTDRSSWMFEFSRNNSDFFSDFRRWLRIHVVRCEPYQHILSLHSSGLMNFMTWKHAVSLFPRSTFTYRRSFVSRQESLPSDIFLSSHKRWLEQYSKNEGIKIIGVTDKIFPKTEIGDRFIGDKNSWIMEMQPVTGNFRRICGQVDGPSFEVLDWRSGTTTHESYLRTGEPRVWSTWSRIRRANSLIPEA